MLYIFYFIFQTFLKGGLYIIILAKCCILFNFIFLSMYSVVYKKCCVCAQHLHHLLLKVLYIVSAFLCTMLF